MLHNPEIWITGVGIVSSLGMGMESTKENLFKGSDSLHKITNLDTIHAGHFYTGQILSSDEDLRQLTTPLLLTSVSRTTLLAACAIQQAIHQANTTPYLDNISLITSSTVAGISTTEKYYLDLKNGRMHANHEFVENMDCGAINRSLARNYGIGGDINTISTACSGSSNAIIIGAKQIENGLTSMAICGGSDALSKFTINGFNSLKNVDPDKCKPFDAHRAGLNLGEGAAYVILEEAQHARNRGAKPLAILAGYANMNENYHLTSSSPDGAGPQAAMQSAMQKANIVAKDVDYIHAHGTATLDNDIAEGNAIKSIFTSDVAFSSTKSMTGHTLAASGAIGTVLSIIAMQERWLLPNVGFSTPMPEHLLKPSPTLIEDFHIQYAMINAFGFGGNNASLIIQNVD